MALISFLTFLTGDHLSPFLYLFFYITAITALLTVNMKYLTAGQKSQPAGNLTISIGIAIFPDDASEKRALTRRADQALYQAKKSGRNQVQAFGEYEAA